MHISAPTDSERADHTFLIQLQLQLKTMTETVIDVGSTLCFEIVSPFSSVICLVFFSYSSPEFAWPSVAYIVAYALCCVMVNA